MLTPEGFEQRVRVLIARGFSPETAYRYISLIGDTPKDDENGKIIVRDESGAEIDRIDPID
jgi:hypothetical protein